MNYLTLKGTDLTVSAIALGTMHFGTEKVSEAEARRQLDAFLGNGGNFIDTARIYGAWERGDAGYPLSEMVIGRWLWDRRNRERVVLSTKGAHPFLSSKDRMRLSAQDILSDLDKSLEHLRTDYVDIYFLHRDDATVPVSSILETLEGARMQGKLRYYGCSNWTLGRMKEAEAYAREHSLEGFRVNQTWVCLPDISKDTINDRTLVPMDREMYSWESETGLPAMAYSSIARGYLVRLSEGRELTAHHLSSYENASSRAISRRLSELGLDPLQASLQSLMRCPPFQIVPIVSFTDRRQMDAGLEAVGKPFPEELREVWAMKKFTL